MQRLERNSSTKERNKETPDSNQPNSLARWTYLLACLRATRSDVAVLPAHSIRGPFLEDIENDLHHFQLGQVHDEIRKTVQDNPHGAVNRYQPESSLATERHGFPEGRELP